MHDPAAYVRNQVRSSAPSAQQVLTRLVFPGGTYRSRGNFVAMPQQCLQMNKSRPERGFSIPLSLEQSGPVWCSNTRPLMLPLLVIFSLPTEAVQKCRVRASNSTDIIPDLYRKAESECEVYDVCKIYLFRRQDLYSRRRSCHSFEERGGKGPLQKVFLWVMMSQSVRS